MAIRPHLYATNVGNVVAIIGKTGTGKSTSIKTLDPKETVILNLLNKRLPFRGSDHMYSLENKNLFPVDTYDRIIAVINNISEKATHVKNVIIDDISYIMRKEFFARAKERGYEKFNDIGTHMQQVISACEHTRPDLNIFLMFHADDVTDGNNIVEYKISTVGKMVDQTYNPLEVVEVALFSASEFDADGNITYGFYTKRQKVGGVIVPAKSPDGMFADSFIPNDLAMVVKTIDDYHNAE